MPCEFGFAQLLADVAVLIDGGGLPLRFFSASQGAMPLAELQMATVGAAVKPTQWQRRREISECIRSRLCIVLAISSRTMLEFSNHFYILSRHALILNMDFWTRQDMVSYCASALRQQCDLPKTEACCLLRLLMLCD